MIAFPATVTILILGILFLQYNHYQFIEKQKNFVGPEQITKELVQITEELKKLKKDMKDQNERIDALMLKAGFAYVKGGFKP